MAQQHRTLQELRLIRERKLHELQELGYEAFPHFYEQTHHADEIQAYEDADFPTEEVSVAGRVVSLRRMGKASFAHLQDQSGRQQIYVKRDEVGEKVYEEMFRRIDLGDYLGCRGEVFRTRTGEITVKAKEVTLLAKSLRPLPNLKEKDGEVFDPFEDKESRYRRRYLDLIANPDVKDVFIKRAEIIRNVRSYLDKQAFLEVETPVLQPIYGGASARPFTTHHHALDQTLYLRIADELYLKRLVIGGFERVYEIAKNFRNEGMDKSHNPEFTALEFYMAYVDYKYLMAFTENLIKTVATSMGVTKARFMGHEVDLTKPFAHARMFDLLKEHTGEDLSAITDVADLYKFTEGRKLDVPKGLNYGQLLDKIFGTVVEPHLIQPIFVIDHPRAISPMAKLQRDGNDLLVERFELFIGGSEFANAFTELNDPIDQRQRLELQADLREAGDDEAQVVDEDFIEAMEFGMPPMGGVGVGIDRLVMLLTSQDTIKDVILFPAMRPQR